MVSIHVTAHALLISLVAFACIARAYHCDSRCDDEGLKSDLLLSVPIPDQTEMTNCAAPAFCDDSTPGTGHQLFEELTPTVVAAEKCYSFCFTNYTPDGINFTAEAFSNVYNIECSTAQNAYVCLTMCLTMNRNRTLMCSDLCQHSQPYVCERAFSASIHSTLTSCNPNQCSISATCSNICDAIIRNVNFTHLNENTVNNFDVLGNNSKLILTGAFGSSDKGGLEFDITDIRPTNTAYGIIWRVQQTSSNKSYYIPQHLPFLLSQNEVGPLYRISSNLLAVRQFQCLPDLMVSYALVNQYGISQFSQPTEQCFLGNAFLQPPSNIDVKFSFIEYQSDLKVEITVNNLSPNHSKVEQYGFQVFKKEKNELSFIASRLFPDKEHLEMEIEGFEQIKEIFNEGIDKNVTYLFGVYALPQRFNSSSGRNIMPASYWETIYVNFPDHPFLDGNLSYTLTRDHICGTANMSIEYKVTTGWKSLAPISKITGYIKSLKIITVPFGEIEIEEIVFFQDLATNVNKSEYHYFFDGLTPSIQPDKNATYKFTLSSSRKFDLTDGAAIGREVSIPFTILSLAPSKVQHLKVCFNVLTVNKALALNITISWQSPLYPEGTNLYRVIFASDHHLNEPINTTDIPVQLQLPNDRHVFQHVLHEADVSIFKSISIAVIAISKYSAVGEEAIIDVPLEFKEIKSTSVCIGEINLSSSSSRPSLFTYILPLFFAGHVFFSNLIN